MGRHFLDDGLFWIPEVYRKKERKVKPDEKAPKTLPPIPDTGWKPREFFPDLSRAERIGIDCETFDPDLPEKGPGTMRGSYIAGVSVATDDGFACYYPVAHTLGQNLPKENVYRWLSDQLSRPRQPKVGAHILYDLEFMAAEGIEVAGPFYDVQYADPLIDEYAMSYSLESIAQRRLGLAKETSVVYQWCADAYGGQPNGKQRANLWRTPSELVGPYAEQDARLPLKLWSHQAKVLRERNMIPVLQMECELIPLLLRMRQRGVLIDMWRRQALDDELCGRIETMSKEVGINVYSAEDLKRLCDAEGISYPMTAGTPKSVPRPSFVKSWLNSHAHPKLRQVAELRKFYKMRDTFLRGAILNMQVLGRVHCEFNPLRSDEYGTVSGRFSSSHPNLQQIPIRDPDWGPRIRSCFIPDEGKVWMKNDLCLTGDTEVCTIEGNIAIKDIAAEARALCVDPETQRLEYKKISRKVMLEPNDIYEVKLLDGTSVRCTAEHKWLTQPNGKQDKSWGWKKTIELKPGDNLAHVYWWESPRGYKYFSFRGHRGQMHQLIAEHGLADTCIASSLRGLKIGEGTDDAPAYEVDHIDGNPRNNRLSNLRWLPAPENHGQGGTRYHAAVKAGLRSDEKRVEGVRKGIKENRRSYVGKENPNYGKRYAPGATGRPFKGELFPCIYCGTIFKRYGKDFPGRVTKRRTSCSLKCAMAFRRKNHEIISIERTGTEHVYQITVDDHHNYVLANGLVSGNSQIEFRLGVHFGVEKDRHGRPTNIEAIRDQYRQDHKTHFYKLAAAMTGLQYIDAKSLSLGTLYGMGLPKFALMIGKPIDEARKIFQQFNEKLPFMRATYDATSEEARSTAVRDELGNVLESGYVVTIGGRVCHLDEGFEHKSLNRKLQGSCADWIKRAMLNAFTSGIFDVLSLGLTVHDELDTSVPLTQLGVEASQELHRILISAYPLKVPVLAGIDLGRNWGELSSCEPHELSIERFEGALHGCDRQ